MSVERPPTIAPPAAARWQGLSPSVSPWLHEEVGRRMQERLGWIVRQPQRWLHWEPLRGGLLAHTLVAGRYPDARCDVFVAQTAQRALVRQRLTRPWWHPARWRGAPQFPAVPVPGAAGMLWANMALHMAADPQALIRQWYDALAVDGFLMFSCFGPDTLRVLRALSLGEGGPAPAHDFTDMHDWGDMLVAAGFAEPVMDMERIELTFETPARLLQELRELGRNLHPARFAGLRGRGWRDRLHAALRRLADPAHDGRLKLTFEVIYGHAFKPQRRLAVAAETTLSLDEMRRTLRQHRAPGGAEY
jgi:malonyl-CoA O-methyltransferase